jgi:GMP synthase (glutamine-hydrolysing)
VCFGHQLIGAAFGGEVVVNPTGWELTTSEVALTDRGRADPLFDGLPDTLAVNSSHRDVVRPDSLAPQNGAEVLAGNAKTPVQAIAAGPHLRGVQFHPEFTGEIIRAYIHARRDVLTRDARDRGISADEPDQLLPHVRDCPLAEQVFHNFLHHFVARRPSTA